MNNEINPWEDPLLPLMLAPGEIHVWRGRLDGIGGDDDYFQKLLSWDEKERASRFRFNVHRERFIRSHGILRSILSVYSSQLPDQILIRAGARGKPYLDEIQMGKLCFNLSHSGDLMVCAITYAAELGIDIELPAKPFDWREIAAPYFSTQEWSALEGLSSERQMAAFYRLWTVKEAFLKANGQGISGGLKEVVVEPNPDHPPQFVSLPGSEAEKNRWQVVGFQPATGVYGALVFERMRHGQTIRQFNWRRLPI